MAKSSKPRRPVGAARARSAEGGRPDPPQKVEAEQAREADEIRQARGADASKSVKKRHTGGR